MTNLTTVAANKMLDHMMGTTAWTITTPVKGALASTIGSDSAAGTELVGGSYARVTFTAAAASGKTLTNAADILFTGLPAADIAGMDIYDSTGTPVRQWWLPLNPAAYTVVGSTDLFTATAHGMVAGNWIMFGAGQVPTGLTANTKYYVIASGLTANDFKVSATFGGSTVDVTADGSGTLAKGKTVTNGDSYKVAAGSLSLALA